MTVAIPPSAPPSSYAGIDWGHRSHVVWLIDALGQGHKRTFVHSEQGCQQLCQWLHQQSAESGLSVAIETPVHPLADLLLAQGTAVYSLNPRQAAHLRERRWVSGAKDDSRDAALLADGLRSDLPLFRPLTPPSEDQVLLRAVSRRHERLSHLLTGLSNQLWACLSAGAPGLLDLCHGANEPFFWDLLEAGADEECARRLRLSRVRGILRRHHIRRHQAEEVLALLRGPRLWCSAAAKEAALGDIASLLEPLRAVHTQVRASEAELERLLAQAGQEAAIVRSFPGLGPVLTATLLGEAGTALAERNLGLLRQLCGAAPVTKRSGRMVSVQMRRSCNRRLRDACFLWARTAARVDPWAHARYRAALERGHSSPRALRGLADRLLGRLVAALRSGTLYQPPAGPAAGRAP